MSYYNSPGPDIPPWCADVLIVIVVGACLFALLSVGLRAC